MRNRSWILCGIAAIAATYVIANRSRALQYPMKYDDLESAANRTSDWATKQRIEGSGANLMVG